MDELQMPRKSSDKIITHRIEFSPKERDLIETVIKTQKENQRLDAATGVLQAVGTGLAGTGGLIAALGLVAWLGFNVVDDLKEKASGFVSGVTNVIAPVVLGKTVDELAQEIIDECSIDYRAMEAEARDIIGRKNRFCNTNSKFYDAQECAVVDAEFQIFDTKLRQARQDMQNCIQMNIADPSKETLPALAWGLLRLKNLTQF